MTNYGDITKISGYNVPSAEVAIGGSPCQNFSQAGNRMGLKGEESILIVEMLRVIKEMREMCKNARADKINPRYMVWENVPGAFSSNNGEDFRKLLEEIAKIVDENAVIPRPPKGKWRNAGVILGDGFSIAWRVFDAQFWGVPQRRRRIALVADFGGHTAPEILFERESVCGHSAESGEARERAAADFENGTYPAVARTLTARNDGSPCIDRGPNIVVQTIADDGNICPTLTGDHENRVTDYTAIVIATGQSNAEILRDISPTLNCNHEQPIVFSVDCRNGNITPEINGTLQAHPSGGTSLNLNNVVMIHKPPKTVVRRLTPLECERLQGYPDGWCDIGDWTDSKGKNRKTTDTARYKALGNSIALPPWRWVLSRLIQHCEDKTMASLFDGIGGFPLIWRELGGTTEWTSEIEEFCCAVTKERFCEVNYD